MNRKARKALVLNADYQAIGVVPIQRAFTLVLQDKVEMVAESDEHMLRSSQEAFKAPSIIRLRNYVVIPFKKVPLSRLNIYRRDNFECQYCGSKKHLTLDHVQPKSKGGRDAWNNLVTACHQCNTTKGDRLLEEIDDLELRKQPFRPSFVMFLKTINGSSIDEQWFPYLYM